MAVTRREKPQKQDSADIGSQPTAAAAAQSAREKCEEVELSSDKEMEEKLGVVPMLPSEAIVFAVHFAAGTNEAAAMRAAKGPIGQKLVERVRSCAPKGEEHMVPTMMLPSAYRRQGEAGFWVQIRVAAPPGTLAAVTRSPLRCQDYLCLGLVALGPNSEPANVGARIVDIHRVLPTVYTISGVPPQVRTSALSHWLADAYRRPAEHFGAAQRIGHTAGIAVTLPEGTKPLPEYRPWRWLTQQGLRRGTLHAGRRAAAHLGLIVSVVLPQHQPGTKEEAAAARQAAAKQEWDATVARVTAVDCTHPAGPVTAAGGPAAAAAEPTAVPAPAGQLTEDPVAAEAAPACNTASKEIPPRNPDLMGLIAWRKRFEEQEVMRQQLEVMRNLPPLPESPPSPVAPLQQPQPPLPPLPQRQQQQQPQQQQTQTQLGGIGSGGGGPSGSQRPPRGAKGGKAAELAAKLLAASPGKRGAVLVRESSPRTRQYLESCDFKEIEEKDAEGLAKWLATLPMRANSAASRKSKAKKQKLYGPEGKG